MKQADIRLDFGTHPKHLSDGLLRRQYQIAIEQTEELKAEMKIRGIDPEEVKR